MANMELSNYDITKASHCWQFSLKVLKAHAQLYGLSCIFRMPDFSDLADGLTHSSEAADNVS